MSKHRLETNPPALADELVKFIYERCSAETLIRDHAPNERGVCPKCRAHGCSAYTAARVVMNRGGSLYDLRMHAIADDFEKHGARPDM